MTQRWPSFLTLRRGHSHLISGCVASGHDGAAPGVPRPGEQSRRQTDPQSLRRATGSLPVQPGPLFLVHEAASSSAAEPPYPDGPLASRRAPTEDEVDQARRDVLDGYATLGRVLSTPAINSDAEARRQWAIDVCTSEIARMERNLLELRQES